MLTAEQLLEMDRPFEFAETSAFGPPHSAGVYAVCYMREIREKEVVLYIGSSVNIAKRLANREHPYRRCFDVFEGSVVYTKCIETPDYIQHEKRLIEEYRPLLNRKHNG